MSATLDFLGSKQQDYKQRSFLTGDPELVVNTQRKALPGSCAPFLFLSLADI